MTVPTLDVPHDGSATGVPLPPAAGVRALRRRRRRQERRQRRLLLGILAAAVAATVFAVASPGGDEPATETAAPAATTVAGTVGNVLVAHRAADGSTTWITLLAPTRKTPGGSIVLIPVGTMTEIASLGLEPIGRALQLSGAQRLSSSVENLLGVDVARVVVLDDESLVGFVEPLRSLRMRIPARVEQVREDETVEVLWEEGLTQLRPAEVPQLLGTKGRNNELSLQARHQAFWQTLLERSNGSNAPAASGQTGVVWRTLRAIDRGDGRVRILPVEPVGRIEGEASNPDGEELYQVRSADLRAFVTGAFPEVAKQITARPRVQVLNGTGTVELAPRVEAELVPAGMQVTLTGNAARFNYTETQIVFYDRAEQRTAERVRRALGVGKLVLSRRPIGVVDVTVIVGKDFLSR